MASKRPREDDTTRPSKKQRKGFSVGPANLPDGTYKRKVQKIKKGLIDNAKIKKQFYKLKAREEATAHKSVYDREDDTTEQPSEPGPEPNLEPHPDRVKMLERSAPVPDSGPEAARSALRPKKWPRTMPFQKEAQLAQKQKEDQEVRRKAREMAQQERTRKIAERERFRKVMAKARSSGPNGRRKLGRESTVLVEKARRMVGIP